MIYEYKGITFVCDTDIDETEAQNYIERGLADPECKGLQSIAAHIDGDEVELTYHMDGIHFNRLRRITGYLVGDMNRWNDGKRAEEHDRVKHTVEL